MMTKLILLIFIITLIFSCSNGLRPDIWPPNSALITAATYEFELADSSKMVTPHGDNFTLVDVTGLLITKQDTISYNVPDKKTAKLFPGININSAKTYQSNPRITEYYTFDKGAVKLAGYATNDSISPVASFTAPLIIMPKMGVIADSTIAYKQNWISRENRFEKDTKIKTTIKLIKSGSLLLNGQIEEFLLYTVTLTGDAKVAFGEKELIVPDAIYMQSTMVIGKTKGLICEWSIKTHPIAKVPGVPSPELQPTSYIEFINYNPIKN